MDTKLTLKLNKEILEKAKLHAKLNNLTLTGLIEEYLRSLIEKKSDGIEFSPFVKSFSSGVKIPNNFDYKSEYLKKYPK